MPATLLFTGGCQAPPAPTGPTEMVLRIPDRDAFIDASLSLLRRCDLPPERVDRTRGLIISQRTTSGQWCEPWRVDSQGAYQVLESSLHTIGRVVTIAIEPFGGQAGTAEEGAATSTAAPETTGTDARLGQPPSETGETGASPATAPSGRYRVCVRVDKSRYTTPERQITTASGAIAIYSARIPTVEGERGQRAGDAYWVSLGRDPLLEAFLLSKLVAEVPDVELGE